MLKVLLPVTSVKISVLQRSFPSQIAALQVIPQKKSPRINQGRRVRAALQKISDGLGEWQKEPLTRKP